MSDVREKRGEPGEMEIKMEMESVLTTNQSQREERF